MGRRFHRKNTPFPLVSLRERFRRLGVKTHWHLYELKIYPTEKVGVDFVKDILGEYIMISYQDYTEIAHKKHKVQKSIYDGSINEWFVKISSPRKKGKIGEDMQKAYLRNELGFEILPADSSDHDYQIRFGMKTIKVRTKKSEGKTSSSWNNQPNNFKFQQIRENQNYDILICWGINPNDTEAWFCTKEDLQTHVFGHNEYRQHAGKDGKQNIYWITNKAPFLKPLHELGKY